MSEARSLFEPMEIRSVEIERAGRKIKVGILLVNGLEGVTIQQAADLFCVSYQNIYKHMNRYAICSQPLVESITNELKSLGVIPLRTNRTVRFLSKDALKELVWIIGTDAAKAAYYQLWNDAEELMRIKPKYEAQQQQIADLSLKVDQAMALAAETQKQNEELIRFGQEVTEESKAKDLELRRLRNQLQAAVDHLEYKGKDKRRIRHSIVDIEFVGVNIFEGPQYRVSVKKLEISEMNGRERDVFGLQRGISSVRGIAGSMQERARRMEVNNAGIMGALKDLSAASDNAYHQLVPGAGRVFGLKDGESIEYMN